MIVSFTSVQFSVKRARRNVYVGVPGSWFKTYANRRHRHALNRITRNFARDPEAFEDEGFGAPSFGGYDLD